MWWLLFDNHNDDDYNYNNNNNFNNNFNNNCNYINGWQWHLQKTRLESRSSPPKKLQYILFLSTSSQLSWTLVNHWVPLQRWFGLRSGNRSLLMAGFNRWLQSKWNVLFPSTRSSSCKIVLKVRGLRTRYKFSRWVHCSSCN